MCFRFSILKRIYWLLFFNTLLCSANLCFSQVSYFNMHDTVVTDCKGFFYDSQGPADIYLYDEDLTFTINTGGVIVLIFDTFCVEIEDSIRFFDGPDTLSPQIGPAYFGNIAPPIIQANSGWLTISFMSDNSVAYCGWEAYWTTIVPQPIPPVMSISSVPLCNSTIIDLVFSSPLRCDSISFSDFIINGPSNISVINAIPQNCINDSSITIQLVLDMPLDENCNYYVDFNLDLLDACDSVWSFLLSDSFLLTSCPPNVLISVGNDSICSGTCTEIEAVLTSCLSYNYSWNQGLPSASGPFTVCPTVNTDYTVTVQDVGGISPPASYTITIFVVDPQIIDADTTLCQSDSAYNLQAFPAGGFWRGSGIIDSVTGFFNPDTAGPGLHLITYNMAGNCEDSLFITVKAMDAGFDEAACPGSPPFMVSGFSPVGGTWSGDSIQANGLFNPDTNGVYTITYSFNGCSEDKLVYVENLVGPIQMDTVCQSVPPYDISISPFGGRWYGTGITDSIYGTFDPDIAGGGLHEIEYKLNGCVDTVQIYVHEIDVGYWLKRACPLQVPFTISPPAIPSGGWWAGLGIIDSITGLYDPNTFNGANYNDTLIYELANGCTDTMVMSVTQTKIYIDTLFFCIADDSLKLNWTSVKRAPGGGIWTGSGLSGPWWNTFFNPASAGPGVHTLVYTANDCSDSIKMIVYPLLNNLDTIMCSSQDSFVIQQMPPGGYWWGAGSGIIDNYSGLFDPGIALQDTQYVYFSSPAGCKDSVRITVYPFEYASISGLDSVYCFVNQNQPFVFTPSTATILGPVMGNLFNPATAGEGMHTLMVSYGLGVCRTEDSLQILVHPELTGVITSTNDTICYGQGATLNVAVSGGVPNSLYSYSWNQGLFPIDENTVNPQSSTTYVVTSSDGCSDDAIDTITVVIAEQFAVMFSTSEKKCYGDDGYALATVFGNSTYAYNWDTNPIQTSDSITGYAGDSYMVNITDVFSGCEFDTLIKIPNYSIVNAMFSISPNLECVSFDQKDLLTIIDLSKNVDSGYWDFDNGSIAPYIYGKNPNMSFEKAGYYSIVLSAYNEGGCFDEYRLDLCIFDPVELFVAEAFSPNGDGSNDVLFVRGNGVVELDFFVYNRWGEKVFESHNVNYGWDGTFKGKLLNSEVFVYYVHAVSRQGVEIEMKGDVSLIR